MEKTDGAEKDLDKKVESPSDKLSRRDENIDRRAGVYILVENGYLFPPPLGNQYFFPKKTA
jgi:hypothetical protein